MRTFCGIMISPSQTWQGTLGVPEADHAGTGVSLARATMELIKLITQAEPRLAPLEQENQVLSPLQSEDNGAAF